MSKKGADLAQSLRNRGFDMQEPAPSASGKTKVVASTHGNQPTTVTIQGKPVIVGLNAYIRN